MEGHHPAVPRHKVRHRSTPCHSGVQYAIHWRPTGNCEIGKNVPENRNIGMMPNRRIVLRLVSRSIDALNAQMGVANARPVSVAAGIASRARGDSIAPKTAMTNRKTTVV